MQPARWNAALVKAFLSHGRRARCDYEPGTVCRSLAYISGLCKRDCHFRGPRSDHTAAAVLLLRLTSAEALTYVYGWESRADADTAKALTMDEARRIASNIAKLPTFLAANPDAANE